MSNQFFNEEFFLMYLYKKKIFNPEQRDTFLKNIDPNIIDKLISNRNKSSSYIKLGLIDYDREKNIIHITELGRQYIEDKFAMERSFF